MVRPADNIRSNVRWICASLAIMVSTWGCESRESSRSDADPSNEAGHSTGQLAPGEVVASPLLEAAGESGTTFRRWAPEESGLSFRSDLDVQHPMRRLYHSGFVCGGVSVGDVDGDGRSDVFLVSGPEQNRLYRQTERWHFEEITQVAFGELPERWGTGGTMVDIEGDGDLDLYVCNYDAPNQLFINNGQGVFRDMAASYGLDVVDASLIATFADYDCDGDLDMYLLTNQYYREGGRPAKPPIVYDKQGIPHIVPAEQQFFTLIDRGNKRFNIDDYGRDDQFYRNDGDGRFQEISGQIGIAGHGFGLSATWCDFNSDGWPDLYVCNDFDDPDCLYRNNGDGTFRNVLTEMVPHTAWFSMGSDSGDINNDGWMDIFMVDMSPTSHYKQKTTMGVMNADKLALVAGPPPQVMRNSLLINSGAGRFWEGAYLSGIADTDWSWSTRLVDFDNDGWLDVFVGNGMVRNFNDSDIVVTDQMLIGRTKWDIYQHSEERLEQNLAFRNQGDLQFEDVSARWGLDHVGMSYGTATGDFDNDGDLDLIVANMNEPVGLYENRSVEGHRLTVQLVGTSSNRGGIGATVTVETTAGRQVRFVQPVSGFLGCSEPRVHFGLGSETSVDVMTIKWPSGIEQRLTDIGVDQAYVVREPELNGNGPPVRKQPAANGEPNPDALFHSAAIPWRHRETTFDDFARQPLLPNKLSQLGPGLAVADIDNDGDDDCYVGGAAGQLSGLLRNDGHGQLRPETVDAFAADVACEDLGALFFDADSDGDQDLYVVSGGVEYDAGDPRLRDRLYWNNGSGAFSKADAATLPEELESGSTVTAADWDRDGDLDLFVGGRVIPGDYPVSPKSYLLRNDGGKFIDVTTEIAGPSLSSTGLVTAAVWTHIDQDGWIDLVVAHEWGPIKIFANREGQFVDTTSEVGIGEQTGWWNGIDSGDMDGDGDMDLVATNFGLNTKYHASLQHPALLYYGDFDKSGSKQLVEAEFENETLFPIRGKSCSTRAMPFLADKFRTFKEFAVADLGELYTPECLNDAERFAATTLKSSLLINNGAGQFEVRALPALAQIAPGFGVVVSDLTGDGKNDIYVVHNFFTPQAETGRMDGGMSLLLQNQGEGKFHPVPPLVSGLVVPGDAKSAARCDLNQDRFPDLLIGVNDDDLQLFLGRPTTGASFFEVRLKGSAGNRTGVGARVTLHTASGERQVAEIRAGGGYLSQSTSRLLFGIPAGTSVTEIEVDWPTGEQSRHRVEPEKLEMEIELPSRS